MPQPNFSAMADYRLPQVFFNTGVLRLDEPLLTKLTNGVVLEKNSEDELLLRAYTIDICNRLAKLMQKTEAEVDGMVWSYSQEMITRSKVISAPRVATDCY